VAMTSTAPPQGAPTRPRQPAKAGQAPAEPEASAPKKKGKKKLRVVLVLVVVLVLGVGYMMFMKKPPPLPKGAPTTTAGGPLTEETSLTVNLRDGHYLEFTAAIQTLPGKSDKILTTDQPIVLDILNDQAQVMTEGELLEPSGPALLKADIVRALNHEFPGIVQAVYFEQFVMQ